MKTAYQLGEEAHRKGELRSANPFKSGAGFWAWDGAWCNSELARTQPPEEKKALQPFHDFIHLVKIIYQDFFKRSGKI